MKNQLDKMLMDELLTDGQLTFYEQTIAHFHNPHGTVYRHSKALILGYRDLKSKVEEMKKTLEWYADEKNWGSIEEYGAMVSDGGKLARTTLKGESQ